MNSSKIIIVLMFLISLILNNTLEHLCMYITDFKNSQFDDYNAFNIAYLENSVGSGSFGEIKKLVYKKKNSVVKIQYFDNFSYNNEIFYNAFREIENLKTINESIEIIKLIREESDRQSRLKYEDRSLINNGTYKLKEIRVIKHEFQEFLQDLKKLKLDIKDPGYLNSLGDEFKNLNTEEEILTKYIEQCYVAYSSNFGEENLNNFDKILLKQLDNQMILEIYDCVYDPSKFEIYIFLKELADTFENEIPIFQTLSESERISHYLYLLIDIRKIHSQLKMVHLDIKPDNIMITKKFQEEKIGARLKYIDYGLMRPIGAKVDLFYRLFAHPDLLNKKKNFAEPFYDIYSFMLSIAYIEFGKDSIQLNSNCYREREVFEIYEQLSSFDQNNGFSEDCFSILRRQIIYRFCEKMERERDSRYKGCEPENIESLYYNLGLDGEECDNLACFVLSNISFEGSIMKKKLEDIEQLENEKFDTLEDPKNISRILSKLKYNVPGGFNYGKIII